jgi:hypothetical protein
MFPVRFLQQVLAAAFGLAVRAELEPRFIVLDGRVFAVAALRNELSLGNGAGALHRRDAAPFRLRVRPTGITDAPLLSIGRRSPWLPRTGAQLLCETCRGVKGN